MVELRLKAIRAPELMLLIALLYCLIIVNVKIIVINIAFFIETSIKMDVLYMDYIT